MGSSEADPVAVITDSQKRAQALRARHDLAVGFESVRWDTSSRAKRRAAAVRRPRIPGARIGEPIAWEDTTYERCPEVTLVLTLAAARSLAPGVWEGVLLHELLHIEQFQRFGATDHGPAFRDRAAAVGAPLTVPRFAPPRYALRCSLCESTVAERYRRSRVVTDRHRYRSGCCDAPLMLIEHRRPSR
jgi:hypothetical protein